MRPVIPRPNKTSLCEYRMTCWKPGKDYVRTGQHATGWEPLTNEQKRLLGIETKYMPICLCDKHKQHYELMEYEKTDNIWDYWDATYSLVG